MLCEFRGKLFHLFIESLLSTYCLLDTKYKDKKSLQYIEMTTRTPIKFYDTIPVKYHIGKHSLNVMESTHNIYLTHTRLDRVVRRLFPEEMTLELSFET